MTKREKERYGWWARAFDTMGITADDRDALRRISMTLDRWHEQECGSSNDYASFHIEREFPDTGTGKAYMRVIPNRGDERRYQIPDRETGALKRLKVIMARYPHLVPYVQGDPRGGALHILPVDKLAGRPADQYYSSVGVYANYD